MCASTRLRMEQRWERAVCPPAIRYCKPGLAAQPSPAQPCTPTPTPSIATPPHACRPCPQILSLPACRHSFHEGCILDWLRLKGMAATCPNCKAAVFTPQEEE